MLPILKRPYIIILSTQSLKHQHTHFSSLQPTYYQSPKLIVHSPSGISIHNTLLRVALTSSIHNTRLRVALTSSIHNTLLRVALTSSIHNTLLRVALTSSIQSTQFTVSPNTA
ncbi:hypothetical protein BgiBS90_013094 [Biomphalaria glabrata]|nr:hypothetical protein BgiBS90_013094 [Biomphalaria glabrata]